MHRNDHVLIHLTLEPEPPSLLPEASLGAELAAYVRALLENLDAPPIVVGASSRELTLVAPLPSTMSTSHLVFCIKQATQPWLGQNAGSTDFRWAPGYRALSVDLRSLSVTIRKLRSTATHCTTERPSRWIHDRAGLQPAP